MKLRDRIRQELKKERMCGHKVAYLTKEAAEEGAARSATVFDRVMRPYTCHFCGFWHLTKKSQ